MTARHTDAIVIGAGIYGLHAAEVLTARGKSVTVLEYDEQAFQRASYINQARVHKGYHYPRSLSTALKSAGYYDRFVADYAFAINGKFEKIYAVSSRYSYASAPNFEAFCHAAGIPCREIHSGRYFKRQLIEGCYLTEEVAFDAFMIRDYYVGKLSGRKADIVYGARLEGVDIKGDDYVLTCAGGKSYSAPLVLNSTYASVNQILTLFGFETFKIKYEIAELCLCETTDNIREAGLTVMDGPFFSVMPFGLGGYHSLSAVHFTPHVTSYSRLPEFPCQSGNPRCTPKQLENCNLCPARPKTAWDDMLQLAYKYMRDDIRLKFHESLVAIKPILMASEVDDSRPTVVRTYTDSPRFVAVLSGKINTMYDLDEVLS